MSNNFSQHQPGSTSNGHVAWWAWDGNDYEFYYRGEYGTTEYDTPGNPWIKIQPYSTSNSGIYTFYKIGSYVTGIRVALDPLNEPADLTLLGSMVIVE